MLKLMLRQAYQFATSTLGTLTVDAEANVPVSGLAVTSTLGTVNLIFSIDVNLTPSCDINSWGSKPIR